MIAGVVHDARPRYRAAADETADGRPRAQPHPQKTLSEEQLTRLWRGRRFPQGALVTRAGVPVNVIFQGRPGRGPGPDFRGAVIAGPSGVPVRGDVELHVRSSLFRAHGHDGDASYADVILHVVFEDDTGRDTPLPGGGSAPVVALGSWVATRAEELERWLARPLLWREPCHDAVMRMGEDGAADVLDAHGDVRLERKADAFRARAAACGDEQALYEGLFEALGYGGNAQPMLALAHLLSWTKLRERTRGAPSLTAEALLLGSAGLLPSQRGHRGPLEPYVVEIEGVFAASRLPPLPAGLWKTWGVRPENAPARRVSAAAALLSRLEAPSELLTVSNARTTNEAVAPLLVAASGYWRDHHDVCAAPSRLPPAFVGRSRALEIVVNVLIPAGMASEDGALAERCRALYARLPRPAVYGATRFIEEALASEGVRVPVNGRRAQGLLELRNNWCTQGGCGRCGLS